MIGMSSRIDRGGIRRAKANHGRRHWFRYGSRNVFSRFLALAGDVLPLSSERLRAPRGREFLGKEDFRLWKALRRADVW